jgi:hypothetical protein
MKIFLNTTFFIFISCSTVFAYLDPGSASIWLQVIAAGLAGIASTYRLWLDKFLSLFKRKKKNHKIEDNDKINK